MAKEHPVFELGYGISDDITSVFQSVTQATMISGGNNITWSECEATFLQGLQYYIEKENKLLNQ